MRLLFSAIFLLNFFLAEAQTQNGAFNLTLKALLSHSVKEVTVPDAIKSTALFVDARERNEYDVSHVKNALFVGYDNFNFDSLASINKGQKIIVYCSVGYRSEKVAEKLVTAGFTDVSNLVGGIFEWVNQGYAVVDSSGATTQNIHAYNKTWGIWLNKGNKVYNPK
ncbi:MAG: rhodanese-like domain-containing protein [Cyclobacteriaceae bacterium]|nr:rhodanese-like domain-containing protein [Cyclobacteriaceae bacterium]